MSAPFQPMSDGGPAQQAVRELEAKLDEAIQCIHDAKGIVNGLVGHVAHLQQKAAGKSIYEP